MFTLMCMYEYYNFKIKLYNLLHKRKWRFAVWKFIHEFNLPKMIKSDCIAACLACIVSCESCITDCVKEGNQECILLCRDCADICSLCARFEARGSQFTTQVHALCAIICTACAAECRHHAEHHQSCKACAEACKKCAEICTKYATKSSN